MKSSEESFMRCLLYALPKVGKAEVVLKSDNFIIMYDGRDVYAVTMWQSRFTIQYCRGCDRIFNACADSVYQTSSPSRGLGTRQCVPGLLSVSWPENETKPAPAPLKWGGLTG